MHAFLPAAGRVPRLAAGGALSDADLLHTTWFITLGIAAFMIAMLVMLRRLEGR